VSAWASNQPSTCRAALVRRKPWADSNASIGSAWGGKTVMATALQKRKARQATNYRNYVALQFTAIKLHYDANSANRLTLFCR
jgi:hypothetical protein